MRIVAVLEVQWGVPGQRPSRFFHINPRNHSGRRLYSIVGARFVVTNACPELVHGARGKGKPDPEWLADNLRRLEPDVVLLCGKVAQATFQRSMAQEARVIKMPHPAARSWSKAKIALARRRVQKAITNS